MVQSDMSSAFKFFGAIAVISGLVYMLQTSERLDFFVNSDVTLAIAIISGAVAVWAVLG